MAMALIAATMPRTTYSVCVSTFPSQIEASCIGAAGACVVAVGIGDMEGDGIGVSAVTVGDAAVVGVTGL